MPVKKPSSVKPGRLSKREAKRRYKEFVEPNIKRFKAKARAHFPLDKAMQEDLVQEAALRILKNAGRWSKDRGAKATFANVIAGRAMHNAKMKHVIQKRLVRTEPYGKFFSELEAGGKRPWELLSEATREGIVKSLKRLLHEAKVKPGMQHFFLDFVGAEDGTIKSYKEMASRHNLPIGTVKSRISSVRNRLAKAVVESEKAGPTSRNSSGSPQ